MNATGFCPRCGHAVGTIHSRPECDANYDHAYKRRMAQLEAERPKPVRVCLDVGGTYYASSVTYPPSPDNPYAR